MDKDYEILYWNDLKHKLSRKYPLLTNADLLWRHTSIKELLEMIANKLGKTERELGEIISEL